MTDSSGNSMKWKHGATNVDGMISVVFHSNSFGDAGFQSYVSSESKETAPTLKLSDEKLCLQ